MAASVMSLPVISSSRMIEAPKVGTDFLSSSHFAIAQDEAATQPSLKSIFKKDYVPWDISSRPPAAIPPRPAEVLHRDARYFNEKASETTKAYQPKSLPNSAHKDKKLSGTNFKMDRDLSKFDSFHTTHALHYTPPTMEGNVSFQPAAYPMQSFIPQGDPAKAPQPVSDYRDRYRGHDTKKPFKAPSMHQGEALNLHA